MAIGEIFLSAFLQVLFEKLVSTGIALYLNKKKRRQRKSIERWQKNLRLIEALLSDAEEKQFHSNAVKLWLQDLQDLAYDLEDVLDEFVTEARIHELGNDALQEHDSRFGCSPFRKVQVLSFLACSSEASKSNSANYSDTIEQISSRLQDILTQAGALGLSPQTQSREEQREQRSTGSSSLVREPQVYGRGGEKDEIIRRLLEDDPSWENYLVVPVVGKGGIGKTTLAQCVYNDEQVKGHFNFRAWVSVSDVFDVKQITTTIINSATHATHNFSDLNEAHEKLKKLLADERFLIVLDDVWSDKYDPWDQLQTPFQTATKGSRVLVTTRLERVAKNMLKRPTQSPIIYLKGLSDHDCWLLFQQHALVDDNLIDMRDEIVKLFKGLPLAAKALGGLLRKEDKSKWAKILKSNIWSEESGVLPSLRLSYHHLPQHLKRIFAYCSIFPKDHRYVEEDVVLMWMAEGLLQGDEEESMEDKGHSYFLDLVSRSLMEPGPYFLKKYFIMHDLIHDLAQWAVGDVGSTMDIKNISSRTRYFSCTKEVIEDQPWTQEKIGQLRTFAYFGSQVPTIHMSDSSLQRFHHLRLLSMAHMGIKELPNCIGNLKLLRFLDLSFNTELEELPETIRKLCNLQTLLLRGCESLRKLVTNMAHLADLRHLDIDEDSALMEMPLGIGRLTNLRTLKRFLLTPTYGFRISELKNLKSLRGSLDIFGLQNVVRSKDAEEAKLYEKSNLEVLRLFWGTSTYEVGQNIERDVLDQLQPQKSIKELQLKGYKALVFPAWLGSPSFPQMVVIRLEDCKICDDLPPLGSLPSLKELWVKGMDGVKTVGPEFYGIGCSNPFPALKTLHFDHMESWEEWSHPSVDNSKAFSHLEKLEILWCPLLRGDFPSTLPSLKKLKVDNCRKLRISLPSLPLLQELEINGCEELSSSGNVVCCSNRILLTNVFQFTGIQGFCVPGVKSLEVIGSKSPGGRWRFLSRKHLGLVKYPALSHYVYGDLDNFSFVELRNCKELDMFLEHNPSSVRRLKIYDDNSLKQLSRLTNRSTCLQELHIERCSSLSTIGFLPLTLVELVIKDVNIKQPAEEWGLHLLASLRDLQLVNMGSCIDSVESVPGLNFLLPSSLEDLIIHGFPNLKSLSCHCLPKIKFLKIEDCPLLSKGCIQVPDEFKVQNYPRHQYLMVNVNSPFDLG